MVLYTKTNVRDAQTLAEPGRRVDMKHIVVLADGMADEPLEQLEGKTPLEYAHTPAMDMLASMGVMGMVRMVPVGMKPGSDVANLSVLGYNPIENYSGRSPLEALSIGVPMENDDVIFRCNLVTLSEDGEFEEKTIIDHSSDEISTDDASVLMDAVREHFSSEEYSFYTGTSYRHILVWKKGEILDLEPPHDHLGERIGDHLPKDLRFLDFMKRSFTLLNEHPLNLDRAARGLKKANCLWFWGAGTKPSLQDFAGKTGLSGAMISAVDLLKGIAVGAGMDVIKVPGATGSLHTNYLGKAQAAMDALLKDGHDFVYVHIEAPDEMGHQGSVENKIKSIELIDSQIVEPIIQNLGKTGEPFKMLVLPDHPTPIRLRTHTGDPVPFVIYDSRYQRRRISRFSEREAKSTGLFVADGYTLIEQLIGGQNNGESV